jgi:hypothetical protein
MKPALLLLPFLALAADAGHPLTVGRVTVQFPAPPTPIDHRTLGALPATARGWTARTPEGLFFLLRTRLPRPVGQQDTARRRAIYDSITTHALRLSKGRVVGHVRFLTAAGWGAETSYRYINPYSHLPTTFFMRNLVVDSANYFLECVPNDTHDSLGLASAEQRRRFFSSLTVKP